MVNFKILQICENPWVYHQNDRCSMVFHNYRMVTECSCQQRPQLRFALRAQEWWPWVFATKETHQAALAPVQTPGMRSWRDLRGSSVPLSMTKPWHPQYESIKTMQNWLDASFINPKNSVSWLVSMATVSQGAEVAKLAMNQWIPCFNQLNSAKHSQTILFTHYASGSLDRGLSGAEMLRSPLAFAAVSEFPGAGRKRARSARSIMLAKKLWNLRARKNNNKNTNKIY